MGAHGVVELYFLQYLSSHLLHTHLPTHAHSHTPHSMHTHTPTHHTQFTYTPPSSTTHKTHKSYPQLTHKYICTLAHPMAAPFIGSSPIFKDGNKPTLPTCCMLEHTYPLMFSEQHFLIFLSSQHQQWT